MMGCGGQEERITDTIDSNRIELDENTRFCSINEKKYSHARDP